ncbi:hypothetical protein XFF6992_50132 [Xanthomonas citri pv. fuscans]|nr:hypothetical protein XFF6992_50132 [Xanthomonas citri pv. fuscans]SOO33816.1 conserved hypothetical protein [Xanthomonas citri pv. fuscans]
MDIARWCFVEAGIRDSGLEIGKSGLTDDRFSRGATALANPESRIPNPESPITNHGSKRYPAP